jgi:pimeloyl-ACP methyl ester carboxylesterase
MPKTQVAQGTLQYRDEGSGPPVVLIHGLLVNARVWDRVSEALSGDVRCVMPDLPLGSHSIPMKADADLSPSGLAQLIAEFLDRLELDDVTLVGSDTGGALCQLVAAQHPDRIGALVLTNCDAFDNFPPPAFRGVLRLLGRVPGSAKGLELLSRLRAVRRAAMKIAPLTMDPVPDQLLKEWTSPLHDPGVRRDLVKAARGISPEHTRQAAEQLRGFDRPALIAWGMQDRFFPVADAERLAATLPRARLERIENARAFVQMDQPARLASLLRELVPGVANAQVER